MFEDWGKGCQRRCRKELSGMMTFLITKEPQTTLFKQLKYLALYNSQNYFPLQKESMPGRKPIGENDVFLMFFL